MEPYPHLTGPLLQRDNKDMPDELLNRIVAKLVDMDAFLREQVATKEELKASENRMIEHIDGFIKLHETLDQELVMLRSKVGRLEDRLVKVEMKLGLAIA